MVWWLVHGIVAYNLQVQFNRRTRHQLKNSPTCCWHLSQSNPSRMKLRWGICSAGNISNDFVSALSSLPSEDHTVVAIAARSKEKAKMFSEKHEIAVAYEGYEALAKDSNVDIVYIGSINQTHLPICKMFLNRSKNVLCEKPLGLNKREVQEMIDLAKEKDVFFMEAWWSRFFPAITKLQELLTANHIGEIKMVSGTLGVPMVQERLHLKEYGGGGLLDIGVYLYQMTLLIFGTTPLSSSTKGFLSDSGLKECPVARHDESLSVAELLQNARHDVGYLLDADMEKGPMTCQ